MNTKLHAVADANGRPLNFFMTAAQVSDYIGAAARRQGLRRRLVQGSLAGKGHRTLHPRTKVPRETRQVRQAPLQTPKPDRDYVRPSQRLAPRGNPLLSVPNGFLLRHRPRYHRHLLAHINGS